MFGLGFQYVEVETELDEGDFVMIRRVRTHGEREPMLIHNREDCHAFAAFGEPYRTTTALRCGSKCCIDETFAFINGPFFA